MDAIYLDYAASAPLRPEVREVMLPLMEEQFGNASSIHRWGRAARARLEEARERLASILGASPKEIVFTRGGTEADNMAILGRALAAPGAAVCCTTIEHSAVLQAAHAAERAGAPLRLLPVDPEGRVDETALAEVLAELPAVVSTIWVNNETGTIQPVERIAARCREAGAVFHSDAVQALGKVPLRMDRVPLDLLALSAHKVGGPKGVGALFVRDGTPLVPLLHGGGQERKLRPGTEDIAGAAGFALAAELAERERKSEMRRLQRLRDRLEDGIREQVSEVVINGAEGERVGSICNLSILGADAEMLLPALDVAGIAASSGSACASGAAEPSRVLLAMGLDAESAGPSLRFSLGRGTGEAEIERAIEILPEVIRRVRALAGVN